MRLLKVSASWHFILRRPGGELVKRVCTGELYGGREG